MGGRLPSLDGDLGVVLSGDARAPPPPNTAVSRERWLAAASALPPPPNPGKMLDSGGRRSERPLSVALACQDTVGDPPSVAARGAARGAPVLPLLLGPKPVGSAPLGESPRGDYNHTKCCSSGPCAASQGQAQLRRQSIPLCRIDMHLTLLAVRRTTDEVHWAE